MAKALITKRAVDALTPEERQFVLWDSKVAGFGVLCLPSGRKSYVYQYRLGGKSSRATIGAHGSPWTPDNARAYALDIAEKVRKGIDPNAAKNAEIKATKAQKAAEREEDRLEKELAFSAFATRFLEYGLTDAKPRTVTDYRQTLDLYVLPHLKNKPLPAITRADVARMLDAIPASKAATRRLVFAITRRLFNWARAIGEIEQVPFEGMPAPRAAPSRDRVLIDAELRLALMAAESMDEPFGPMFQMIFATGQRREEVAGMDWNEIDRANAIWTLPSHRSKNDDANIVPLNRLAMAALERMASRENRMERKGTDGWPAKGFVFSYTGATAITGFSKGKARLDSAMLDIARNEAKEAGLNPDDCELQPWRLHDARRTLATGLQRLGVRFEVTEAVLNHRSGRSQSGVAAVYQRHDWGPEKRAALDAWAEHCDRLLNPADISANVVALHG